MCIQHAGPSRAVVSGHNINQLNEIGPLNGFNYLITEAGQKHGINLKGSCKKWLVFKSNISKVALLKMTDRNAYEVWWALLRKSLEFKLHMFCGLEYEYVCLKLIYKPVCFKFALQHLVYKDTHIYFFSIWWMWTV